MRLKIALLAAAGSMAVVTGASAQEAGDTYGGLGAGIAIGSDNNTFRSDDASPAAFVAEMETDDAVAVYGALGRYFGGGVRGELELATRTQDVGEIPGDGLGFGGFPTFNDSDVGDITATSLMVNVLKDFNVDAAGRLTPYVGLGAGAVLVRADMQNVGAVSVAEDIEDADDGYVFAMQDKEYVLGGQAMAGLSFDFTDNMMIDVRYKYLATDEYEMGAFVNGSDLTEIDGNFSVHEVTGGLRWNFGGSTPPPVVPAAPPPVEYKTCPDGSRIPVSQACPLLEEEAIEVPTELDLTVYFDYDRANLTDASQAIIAARAAEAREFDISTITVQGNTDTSGSASYNQRLSQRRADVVREALIANGIDASVITIEALGESNPAKPTADGVREPLNRRTEVEFEFDAGMGM